ncbi:putative glutamine amidotransferase DUG3 [Colletotrichum sp. SAR 10_99]|nr:putative glutamine amidotransferase DUG3 [Colletotrichum sp. SAR 10_96]KAJ5006528.1 putative glutamine amidotransferase DUG3 [Colletotrichum sp. SAR 10_99]
MCRFLVYRGSDEILLSKLILDPTHSILKQSFDSRLRLDTRRGQNNADGFGIGFYTDPKLGHAPCLFTSTIPAWNYSEWAFALFLDTLERMGHDPSSQPPNGFGPTVLRKALLKTIALINELIDEIPESTIQSENVDTRSLLNFAVTDGKSIICTRYISSATDEAASLYYSSGTEWGTRTSAVNDRNYQMERRDKGADIVLVASEPLTFERAENWVNVPTNSILTIHNQTVMVHPIIDKYYDRSPYHVRSSAFVQTKGLIANEKISSLLSPAATPLPTPEASKKTLGPIIPFGVSRSHTPDQSFAVKSRPPSTLHEVSTPADSRSIVTISSGQTSTSRPLVQGNIKVKRAAPEVQPNIDSDTDSLAPDDQNHSRTEFGHPNKLSRFFPELTMS